MDNNIPVQLSGTMCASPTPSELIGLMARICEGDRGAYHEFCTHQRVFPSPSGRPVAFAEHVEEQCAGERVRRWCGGDRDLMDAVRKEVIDRCVLMHGQKQRGRPAAGKGIRNACRVILQWHDEWLAAHSGPSEEEQRSMLVTHISSFVGCQLRRARREVSRTLFPGRMRVIWMIGSCRLVLWMPRHMTPAERIAWLWEHAIGCDPEAPGGRQRVQQLINEQLHAPTVYAVPVEQLWSTALTSATGFASHVVRERMVRCLALLVADYLVANFDLLHPSVRVVGPDKLPSLIRAIFNGLLASAYNQKKLSQQFGISMAGLSRWAGKNRCPGWDGDDINDLWTVAQRIFESQRDLIEAA